MKAFLERALPTVQIIFIVIIAIFISKIIAAWSYSKWPNVVTQSTNAVVQAV